MSPSWNQRRAMPVVTMMTFQLGVSGVASRSRLMTPTRKVVPRIVSAIGRMASVLPVPVPATMPNPSPLAASSTQVDAASAFEERVEMQSDSELDGLACRARGRDDNDTPGWRFGRDKGVVVGRKVSVVDGAHAES